MQNIAKYLWIRSSKGYCQYWEIDRNLILTLRQGSHCAYSVSLSCACVLTWPGERHDKPGHDVAY